jgi:single-stranded-DNA-specific exonuclease
MASFLAEECDIDPFVALIASGRGYTDPADLEEFLTDEVILEDIYALADIEKAAEIINEAIYAEEKIVVFGDYDVDGVTATALMYSYLKNRGARVSYIIPDREKDGYGINTSAIAKLKDEGTDLIVTVDNGIAAADEVHYAKSLGMKIVVTDHHLPSESFPDADAVVNGEGIALVVGVVIAVGDQVCGLQHAVFIHEIGIGVKLDDTKGS